jgi:predicted component of type VI protein secretion system
MKDYKQQEKEQQEEIEKGESLEIDVSRLEEIREAARQKVKETTHKWVQKGSQLVCISCEFQHGVYINPSKIMVGIEGNMPKFVDRKSYMRELRDIKF